MSLSGIGRKLPYKAFAKSPSSLLIGWWTVTRYVPVGKVPSTMISVRVEQTDGRTCRRPSMVAPMDMRSATVWLPSRMSFEGVSQSRASELGDPVREEPLEDCLQ